MSHHQETFLVCPRSLRLGKMNKTRMHTFLIHGPGQTCVTSCLKMAGGKMKLNEPGWFQKYWAHPFWKAWFKISKHQLSHWCTGLPFWLSTKQNYNTVANRLGHNHPVVVQVKIKHKVRSVKTDSSYCSMQVLNSKADFLCITRDNNDNPKTRKTWSQPDVHWCSLSRSQHLLCASYCL